MNFEEPEPRETEYPREYFGEEWHEPIEPKELKVVAFAGLCAGVIIGFLIGFAIGFFAL